jgi:hypothetical protein
MNPEINLEKSGSMWRHIEVEGRCLTRDGLIAGFAHGEAET